MKTIKILALALSCLGVLQAQETEVDLKNKSGLKMETEYSFNNEELSDVLSFEGIDYMKIKFFKKISRSLKLTISKEF